MPSISPEMRRGEIGFRLLGICLGGSQGTAISGKLSWEKKSATDSEPSSRQCGWEFVVQIARAARRLAVRGTPEIRVIGYWRNKST